MIHAGRNSAIAAFVTLVLVGLLSANDGKTFSATSYGTIPNAHGALYDLLKESRLPVSRSFAAVERLPRRQTIWWIEPRGLAALSTETADAAAEAEDAEGPRTPAGDEARDPEPSASPFRKITERPSPLAGEALAAWIAAGGTAVVFLDSRSHGAIPLAGLRVPAQEHLPGPNGSSARRARPKPQPVALSGSLAARPRTLSLPEPIIFTDAGEGWRVVADASGKPFAIERRLGAGRLVVVSDARFLWNQWFARADAAPLALDFVRAYGVPRIDEHEHGLSGSQSSARYLAASPAAPFFVGLALFGILFAWFGAALPRREVGDDTPGAPTLEIYVESLASYYGATREYPRVLERYRELTARRLRRALALPPDAKLERILARLERSRAVDAQALALLAAPRPVRDARSLAQAAARLDELVKGVAG